MNSPVSNSRNSRAAARQPPLGLQPLSCLGDTPRQLRDTPALAGHGLHHRGAALWRAPGNERIEVAARGRQTGALGLEAAAYGVPSELSEDDVMIAVAPVAGRTIDSAGLLDFLIQRMAYFMVPRYIRILDELPKTPSAKVQKHLLRREAVTADTWDREAEGRRVRREALGA